MVTKGGFRVTQQELSLLQAHLREQYQGVFDQKMVELHISEFVESNLADNLAAVIARGSQPGETLLDIGSGYGAFVLACRKHGLEARGFELAPFEIDLSRRRLARAEPEADPEVVFRNGDAGRLPFAENAFHIVSLLNVLEHVPDFRAVLTEAVRVLRPGGRLFIICPNYAAFRKEAHYHLPWLPYFPRRLASAYLRWLGRNPRFFEEHIYYCTNLGVLRTLSDIGMRPRNLDVLRLDHPELISSSRGKQIIEALRATRLLRLLKLTLALNLYNPFKAAVTIIASKEKSR